MGLATFGLKDAQKALERLMRIVRLNKVLGRFLPGWRLSRHFQRSAILEAFADKHDLSREIPGTHAPWLVEVSKADPGSLLRRYRSYLEGLTDGQAEDLLRRVGENEVRQEKPLPWWKHLWLCYKNAFNLLLTLLAVISYLTGDMRSTIVILTMVALSTLVRFFQESRSNKAAERLKEMVSNTATVLRQHMDKDLEEFVRECFGLAPPPKGPRKLELPIKRLVPGDIVLLTAGDMVPADLRVLSAKDLFINQAALTGESMPVEKFATPGRVTPSSPLDLANVLFMGTSVVSGSASALIVATGKRTLFGILAERVMAGGGEPSAFQEGVDSVSGLLIRFMLAMTPLVLMINGFTKGDWVQATLFALSIAVGLTPEMLPMIVTSTLAKGAVMLSKKQVIVKRLDAIQNLGAMDLLCTDKTGTLTQDRVHLERCTDAFGEVSEAALFYAYLNSSFQTGLKSLIDAAILEKAKTAEKLDIVHYQKVDEIPFDFRRKRMSVVLADPSGNHLLVCKGAFEEMLSVCSGVMQDGSIKPLSQELTMQIHDLSARMNEEGLRVVAVAKQEIPSEKENYSSADENGLTLLGFAAFLDPPKESASPALRALKEHGVRVKILTGDNERVATKVCREVGMPIEGVLLGSDIQRMGQEELASKAEGCNVFAKLTPDDKERIVRALRDSGHVVGFMGDGINDAPALKAADVGISVDSAVDIAKEAADLILLEKSLLVLEDGVLEGRKTFANMLKYIRITSSSNFGNVFSVLIAGAFLPFLPMLPLQLLVQNLLYDFSQTAIPFDNVDEEEIKEPKRWNPAGIGRFMVHFGPISSLFDIVTYGLMWFVFGANTLQKQTLFQSGWFIEGLFSQTLIVHTIRTQKIPFFQSRPAWPLLVTTVLVLALGVFLPMGVFAPSFRLAPLPLAYFAYLVAILFGYVLLVQAMKRFYTRRYGLFNAPARRPASLGVMTQL